MWVQSSRRPEANDQVRRRSADENEDIAFTVTFTSFASSTTFAGTCWYLALIPDIAMTWHLVEWLGGSTRYALGLYKIPAWRWRRIFCIKINGASPDNLNDRWKRLRLVSLAAAPCVSTLRALTKNLFTYLLTYLLTYLEICCNKRWQYCHQKYITNIT